MDNQPDRKKPGPNQYDPRSYPQGHIVGMFEPTEAERAQYDQQEKTKKSAIIETWKEETKTR